MKTRWACIIIALFFVPIYVDAATLYMEPQGAELQRGDTISVAIRLDTAENECVNVIDAVINYPANLEPVDTSRGRSILTVWVEDPVINKTDRTITFAGGIPNGYCGRIPGDPQLTNTVIEMLFRSPGMVVGTVDDSDEAEITFDSATQVLLNDGFGTAAPLSAYGTKINLLKNVGQSISNEWLDRISEDVIPPGDFSIALERNPNAFNNRFYIVFNTTDKQSGIAHYEVMEEPLEQLNLFLWGAADAEWREVRSPYQLRDQSLNSTIRVRAIDKAGNETLVTLVPEQSQRTLSNQSKVMIAFIVVVLIIFFGTMITAYLLYRRKNNVGKEGQVEVESENNVDN